MTEYFTTLEQIQVTLESWGITIEPADMVNTVAEQMKNSDLFDLKFLLQWE